MYFAPIIVLFGIIIIEGCFRSGFALPSLWLHSRSGTKVDSKCDEKALDTTYLFVG